MVEEVVHRDRYSTKGMSERWRAGSTVVVWKEGTAYPPWLRSQVYRPWRDRPATECLRNSFVHRTKKHGLENKRRDRSAPTKILLPELAEDL